MSDMTVDVLDALEALTERALTTSAEAGAFDLAVELRIDPTAMRRLEAECSELLDLTELLGVPVAIVEGETFLGVDWSVQLSHREVWVEDLVAGFVCTRDHQGGSKSSRSVAAS